LNILFSLLAIFAFFGLVYFWYHHETAKKAAVTEERKKVNISAQTRKQPPQPSKIIKRQLDSQNLPKTDAQPPQSTRKATLPATASESQPFGRNKERDSSPVNKTEEANAAVANKTEKANAAVAEKVFCTRFNVNAGIAEKKIEFWLDTDLPGDTIVMVNLSRPYWIKGRSGTYFGSYFGIRSTVEELRKPVAVLLDDNEWKRRIEKKHSLKNPAGQPLQLSEISDEIELNVTVPINQDNPAFGQRNLRLEGPMVAADHGFKIIRVQKMFQVPFTSFLATDWLLSAVDPMSGRTAVRKPDPSG